MLGASGIVIYPYIIPMLLGRTFDLFTAQVGMDIFSQETIRTPIRIHRSYVTSDFRLIRNDSEARSFLGITEDISLRVKSGVLTIGATGDYLKDVQRRDNYVEILVKTMYETFTETLHGSANPIKDWDLLSPGYLGTHFVRSITYGGMMLASLRLYVGSTAEKESVEQYLASYFNFNELKVTLEKTENEVRFVREMNSFEKRLEQLMYDVKSKTGGETSLRIKYYATVTAPRVPQDLPSFLSILEEFPDQAAKTNGGRGVPVTVELVPLHELSARMVTQRPDSLLVNSLQDLEDKYNDLLYTHNSIRKLSADHSHGGDKKCKVRDLESDVDDKLDVFNQVIQHLDTASPGSRGLSQQAIQAYEQKPVQAPTYYDALKRLEQEGEQADRGNSSVAAASASSDSLDPATVLQQLGYLAEMAMANGICASVSKFTGSFVTMRRNCTTAPPLVDVVGVAEAADPSASDTCSAVCRQLQFGDSFEGRGECVGVVAALLQTPATLGVGKGLGAAARNRAVGAQTANLGRATCDRQQCFHEYCCCRLGRFSNNLL